MTYALGPASKDKLATIHPILRGIVMRAIQITDQDFMVFEGARTVERQRALVAAHASHTMDSMHIPAPDRMGGNAGVISHAVDLVPFIDGQPRWEWGAIYPIAAAVVNAAFEQGSADQLVWGAYWGAHVSQWARPGATPATIKAAVTHYCSIHPGPDFIDGPHWQIGRLS